MELGAGVLSTIGEHVTVEPNEVIKTSIVVVVSRIRIIVHSDELSTPNRFFNVFGNANQLTRTKHQQPTYARSDRRTVSQHRNVAALAFRRPQYVNPLSTMYPLTVHSAATTTVVATYVAVPGLVNAKYAQRRTVCRASVSHTNVNTAIRVDVRHINSAVHYAGTAIISVVRTRYQMRCRPVILNSATYTIVMIAAAL